MLGNFKWYIFKLRFLGTCLLLTHVFSYFSLWFIFYDLCLPCVYWRVIQPVRWCLLWLWFETDASPGSFPTWPMSSSSAFEQSSVKDLVTLMWVEFQLVALSSEVLSSFSFSEEESFCLGPCLPLEEDAQVRRLFVPFGSLLGESKECRRINPKMTNTHQCPRMPSLSLSPLAFYGLFQREHN